MPNLVGHDAPPSHSARASTTVRSVRSLDESCILQKAVASPRRWEPGEQSVRLDLKERHSIRQTGQAMPAKGAEADAGWRRSPGRCLGFAGNDNLSPMAGSADAGYRMHGQTNVPDIGEGRPAAMDPDANPDLDIAGPGSFAERALHGDGRLDGAAGMFEDREEFIGASIDLAAACARHSCSKDAVDA